MLERNPDVPTLELASSAYEDAGDTDRAVGALRQAILLDPMNVHPYLDFAAISAAHQSFQVGINIVNDGIALNPKAAQLYFARVCFTYRSGSTTTPKLTLRRLTSWTLPNL